MIANGNVVKNDDVIFFLTTAHGTQFGTLVYFYQQLLNWSKSAVCGVPEVSIASLEASELMNLETPK